MVWQIALIPQQAQPKVGTRVSAANINPDGEGKLFQNKIERWRMDTKDLQDTNTLEAKHIIPIPFWWNTVSTYVLDAYFLRSFSTTLFFSGLM